MYFSHSTCVKNSLQTSASSALLTYFCWNLPARSCAGSTNPARDIHYGGRAAHLEVTRTGVLDEELHGGVDAEPEAAAHVAVDAHGVHVVLVFTGKVEHAGIQDANNVLITDAAGTRVGIGSVDSVQKEWFPDNTYLTTSLFVDIFATPPPSRCTPNSQVPLRTSARYPTPPSSSSSSSLSTELLTATHRVSS